MLPELNSKIIDYAKANAATEQETFNEDRYSGLIDGMTEVIQNPSRYSVGPVWVNAGFKFPEDWEVKHLRYVADHYPVENSLFEHIRNGLCKIDGTGRLEYHEFEWLDECGSAPLQDVSVLVEALNVILGAESGVGSDGVGATKALVRIRKYAAKALKQFNQ